MIRWIVFRCPILSPLKEQLAAGVSHKPEPWFSHANLCLSSQLISPNPTVIVVGISERDGIIGFVWLSMPDFKILADWNAYTYLFHVFVKENFRGLGHGKSGMKLACEVSKSFGANGILLATDNLKLRAGFYPAFGFRPLRSDPWLMKKYYRAFKKNVSNSPALVRSVSHHDLATIQSICSLPHWFCNSSGIERARGQEVEEEFCEISIEKDERSYLIKGKFDANPYVSWIYRNQSGETNQRILFSGHNSAVKRISSKVSEVVHSLQDMPNSQLGKKYKIVNSLLIGRQS